MLKLDDINAFAAENTDRQERMTQVDQLLNKFSLLIDNPRSPINSTLKRMATYNGDRDVPQFNKVFGSLEDIYEKKYDIELLLKENEKLNKL